MKLFIVFLAIVLLNISFLTYQSDLSRYLHMQSTIKAIAEECGAGAALFFKTPEFADGYLVSEVDEAIKHIEFILLNVKETAGFTNMTEIWYEVAFFDDSLLSKTYRNGLLQRAVPFTFPFYYSDSQGKEIRIIAPSVVVTLNISTKDIFRLPFLEVTEIRRSAMYELKSKNTV